MALQLKLKNTNTINEEGNRVYLTDDTGQYSLTNITGYGAPNASRNSLALVVLGLLKGSKANTVISFEPYNALTTDKFNAVIGQDGWYTFSLISLPIYDASVLTDLPTGSVLYDATYYRIVKVIETPVIDIVPKLPIKSIVEIPIIDLKESSYIVTTVDTLFIANNSKVKLQLNTKISNAIYDGADFTDKKLIKYKDNYNLVRAILQGSLYEFCRGNKFVAQRDIEFLNSNNYVSE